MKVVLFYLFFAALGYAHLHVTMNQKTNVSEPEAIGYEIKSTAKIENIGKNKKKAKPVKGSTQAKLSP